MIIMFVRHAEAKDGKITDLGREQCKLFSKQEENYTFSKIYCSSVERCRETARLINKNNLPIEAIDALSDRQMLGRKPETELEQQWYDNYMNPNFSCSEIEGCKNFLDRCNAEFEKLINRHKSKNENIIIVAHSCTFYALMAYWNKTKGEKINWYRIGNCSKVYFEIEE